MLTAIFVFLIAGMLVWRLFGDGGGDGPFVPTQGDAADVADDPADSDVGDDVVDQDGDDDDDDGGSASDDGEIEDEEEITLDVSEIVYSSIPEYEVYARTWANDEMAIELNRDGTYRYVAPGVDRTGRFTMTIVDGEDRILYMDPDDPAA